MKTIRPVHILSTKKNNLSFVADEGNQYGYCASLSCTRFPLYASDKNIFENTGFEVPMAVNSTVFWVVMQRSSEIGRRFGKIYSLNILASLTWS
jgi:hypothetical protein